MPTVYLRRGHAIQVILLIGFPLHIGSGIHYIVTIRKVELLFIQHLYSTHQRSFRSTRERNTLFGRHIAVDCSFFGVQQKRFLFFCGFPGRRGTGSTIDELPAFDAGVVQTYHTAALFRDTYPHLCQRVRVSIRLSGAARHDASRLYLHPHAQVLYSKRNTLFRFATTRHRRNDIRLCAGSTQEQKHCH